MLQREKWAREVQEGQTVRSPEGRVKVKEKLEGTEARVELLPGQRFKGTYITDLFYCEPV